MFNGNYVKTYKEIEEKELTWIQIAWDILLLQIPVQINLFCTTWAAVSRIEMGTSTVFSNTALVYKIVSKYIWKCMQLGERGLEMCDLNKNDFKTGI